jgi:hypothetical protein
MTKTMTIQSVAEEISKNLITGTRTDGKKYIYGKERIQWQTDIIHKAHLDRLPDDDIYDRIDTILSAWADMSQDADEDEAREVLDEIEPDIYTHDLTAWLHSDNRNVYYLEEAIKEGCDDGFNALMRAQALYIQEIGQALLEGIMEYIASNA